MNKGLDLNFVNPWWRPPTIGGALLLATIMVAGFVLRSAHDLGNLRVEVQNIEHRIEQRKRANEAVHLRERRLSPEERKIEGALAAQSMRAHGSGLYVVDWIEHAWNDEIAIRQIVVEKAGSQARLEGAAAGLPQIYGFVDRLHNYHPDRKVGLIQHQVGTEDGRRVVRFTLNIEKS